MIIRMLSLCTAASLALAGCAFDDADLDPADLGADEAEAVVGAPVIDGPLFGGDGGYPFHSNVLGEKIVSLTVWSADEVDGITVTYRRPNGTTHEVHYGGYGGHKNEPFALFEGEELTAFQVFCAARIDMAWFHTSWGRESPHYGSVGGKYWRRDSVPEGYVVSGLHGRAGSRIDRLGFVYARR